MFVHTSNQKVVRVQTEQELMDFLAEEIRRGTQNYLREKYVSQFLDCTRDLTWHPLFCAVRDLYCSMMSGEITLN